MQVYRQILYFISVVIVITLAIQVYYNIQQYQAGKLRLHREMQIATDQALDNYYIDLAEKNTIGFAMDRSDPKQKTTLDSLLKRIDVSNQGFQGFDSLDTANISEIKVFAGSRITKIDTLFDNIKVLKKEKKEALRQLLNASPQDSLNNLAQLTSRIIFSITTDTLNVNEISSYIEEEFSQRNIALPFGFVFKNNSGDKQVYNNKLSETSSYPLISRSAYLPKKSSFTLYYDKVAPMVFKRNLMSIFLSAVLIAAVIGCLLFLLRIINKQKQLAELKNDPISNITHEFKTPISTVKAALEGITNFNANNDPAKTRNYLEISNSQLGKLQMMVEKLLETATLDGNQLQLEKEEIVVDILLRELMEKHQELALNKKFHWKQELKNIQILGDPFHLENALNNILDNAVKYGGENITVLISSETDNYIIQITDSGNGLGKAEAEQVFEKFYRVPKGNRHDVKGFGIGLYYTKKIIQEHGGSISVEVNKETSFIIKLPKNVE